MADFRKARRGDLAALRMQRSSHSLTKGPTRFEEYLLGRVTAVTRDGYVKEVRTAADSTVRKAAENVLDPVSLLAQDDLAVEAGEVLHALARLTDADRPPQDRSELRELLRPWLKGAEAKEWPNRQGWSVGTMNIVKHGDGTVSGYHPLPSGDMVVKLQRVPEHEATADLAEFARRVHVQGEVEVLW